MTHRRHILKILKVSNACVQTDSTTAQHLLPWATSAWRAARHWWWPVDDGWSVTVGTHGSVLIRRAWNAATPLRMEGKK
jgi:hypothetical protein